jgi:uncharacterized protein with PQ loop repeat
MTAFEILKFYCLVIAPTLSTILISVAYLPQIIKTFKTKSVKDLSLGFWILINAFLLNMVANATYMLITANAIGYFFTEIANFVLALIVLGQIIYYGKKYKKTV